MTPHWIAAFVVIGIVCTAGLLLYLAARVTYSIWTIWRYHCRFRGEVSTFVRAIIRDDRTSDTLFRASYVKWARQIADAYHIPKKFTTEE